MSNLGIQIQPLILVDALFRTIEPEIVSSTRIFVRSLGPNFDRMPLYSQYKLDIALL